MKETSRKPCERLFEDFRIARLINESNLKKILFDNKDTRYGEKYGFGDIPSAGEYAKRVPLSSYSLYEGKITQKGEFVAYPFHDILATSGSTGKQKLFPLTAEALCHYSSYVHDMPYYLTNTSGKALHTSIFRSPKDGVTILSAAYFGWLLESGAVDFDMFVGGAELLFSDEVANVPYLKTWLMFSCPGLSAIQSIYLYDVVMLFAWMEENWQTVIRDIKSRRISADLGDNIKSALLRNIPDEKRIDELENAFERGFDEPVLPRLWPKMRFVCGVGGKMYTLQETQLKKYIGDTPIYQFSYALSECIMAPAIEFGKAYYALLPQSAYYEFLTKDGQMPTSLRELKAGEIYEPVITTFSGLYRYRTGDLIRIERFIGEAPVFEIVGKRHHVLDIAGEKLDTLTANAATLRLAEVMGLEFPDFALGINSSLNPHGYYLFVETDEHSDLSGATEKFDAILKEMSPDYKDLRDLLLLSPPEIRSVPHGEIALSNQLRAKPAHSKPQLFLDGERTDYLLKRSEKNG